MECAGSTALWSAPARRRFGLRRLDAALECAGSTALWSAPARRRFGVRRLDGALLCVDQIPGGHPRWG
ncbi:MAG TPA: hypothetical protein VMS31_00380, partial [Pyrinomonadaceae bacterium]|nr:hypothetical protein [Pyrinomonadaceae bacterium]